MIIHYGYKDGSGEYFITINTEECDGCGECVDVCPQGVLEMGTILIDLEDKLVAVVTEEHRKRIKYSCTPCKPEENPPCVNACERRAINYTWKPS